MKDGKLIYSLHIQLIYLLFGFIHQTVLQRSVTSWNVLHCVNLVFQTYATWNWHSKSATNIILVDRIFVIVLLSM